MTKTNLLSELRELCDPLLMMSDQERVERFTKVGQQAILAFETISMASTQLNNHIETLCEIHAEQVKMQERKIEETDKEIRILRKLDAQANESIVLPLKIRANFTGEFPYHGWQGVGRALEEVLDQRDMYHATLEEILEEFALHQPDYRAIKAMVRGVLKMQHRKCDA